MKKTDSIWLAVVIAVLAFVSIAGVAIAQGAVKVGATAEPAEDRAKTLIVYFSASGNTEKMAAYIHEIIGGDMVELTPVVAYPTEYNALADYAKKEQNQDLRPSFEALDVDPTKYEAVFIGYPIWWYTVPQIILTFFDTYDFKDVTLIPFNTHHGSRDSGTYKLIQKLEPEATVLDGLALRGVDIDREDSARAVKEWLADLGY